MLDETDNKMLDQSELLEKDKLKKIIISVLREIKKYFRNIEGIKEFYLSTMLDPRFNANIYNFRN